MDVQIILVFIFALLSVNLIVVGIYIVLVLREFRQTVQRANNILDNVEKLSNVISNPANVFQGVLSAVMDGFEIVKRLRSSKD